MARRATLPEDTTGDAPEPSAAPASDPAATVRPDDTLPETIPRPVRTLLWQARIGLGVGVLGLCLALAFFLQSAGLRAEQAQREAVLDAGEVVALRVTTFTGAEIDAWVDDTQALSTGGYAEEVAALFDPTIRQGLAEAEVQSVGEVLNSFVQDIAGDRATVFAVLRQTFTSNLQEQAVSDELRMEVRLVEVDGEWLAEDVAVLGPSTITPIDPAAGGTVDDGATEETQE